MWSQSVLVMTNKDFPRGKVSFSTAECICCSVMGFLSVDQVDPKTRKLRVCLGCAVGTILDAHNLVIRKGNKDFLILADSTVLPQWLGKKS